MFVRPEDTASELLRNSFICIKATRRYDSELQSRRIIECLSRVIILKELWNVHLEISHKYCITLLVGVLKVQLVILLFKKIIIDVTSRGRTVHKAFLDENENETGGTVFWFEIGWLAKERSAELPITIRRKKFFLPEEEKQSF
jgi:hypothetical protein